MLSWMAETVVRAVMVAESGGEMQVQKVSRINPYPTNVENMVSS